MAQEHYVIKCFSCGTFQSQIVKKKRKWECKVCGIKQSLRKVYGQGSGKDCRLHTQKLNVLRGEQIIDNNPQPTIKEDEILPNMISCSSEMRELDKENKTSLLGSKWGKYINNDETMNKDEIVVNDRNSSKQNVANLGCSTVKEKCTVLNIMRKRNIYETGDRNKTITDFEASNTTEDNQELSSSNSNMNLKRLKYTEPCHKTCDVNGSNKINDSDKSLLVSNNVMNRNNLNSLNGKYFETIDNSFQNSVYNLSATNQIPHSESTVNTPNHTDISCVNKNNYCNNKPFENPTYNVKPTFYTNKKSDSLPKVHGTLFSSSTENNNSEELSQKRLSGLGLLTSRLVFEQNRHLEDSDFQLNF